MAHETTAVRARRHAVSASHSTPHIRHSQRSVTANDDTTDGLEVADAGHHTVRDDSRDHDAVARGARGAENPREARGSVAGARADAMAVSRMRRAAGRL